jgi:hypothetical protein
MHYRPSLFDLTILTILGKDLQIMKLMQLSVTYVCVCVCVCVRARARACACADPQNTEWHDNPDNNFGFEALVALNMTSIRVHFFHFV